MAWTTPITDWSETDRVTAEDMNRISQNILYIYPEYTGKTAWTQDDIITTDDIDTIQTALTTMIDAVGVDVTVPEPAATAVFFNAIESATDAIKTRIDLRLAQAIATVYPQADGYYINETAENFTRGV